VESLHAAQVSYLPARTYEEAGQEFRRMRKAGFDTVILRVFQNPGDRLYPFVTPRARAGVYFLTAEANVVDDILPELISRASCRTAGLRLDEHAFAADRDPGPARPPLRPGSRRGCCGERLDLFHAEVRRRLLTLYRDLGRYDLDGILLQDDLAASHRRDFRRRRWAPTT
jgi:biofilm PGA synthesis lipoprotein PgaB